MIAIRPISCSIFDFLTFYVLLAVFSEVRRFGL
jgi:hypothetical protein